MDPGRLQSGLVLCEPVHMVVCLWGLRTHVGATSNHQNGSSQPVIVFKERFGTMIAWPVMLQQKSVDNACRDSCQGRQSCDAKSNSIVLRGCIGLTCTQSLYLSAVLLHWCTRPHAAMNGLL